MLLSFERLFDVFLPVFQMFQQLHPCGDAILMLIAHVETADRSARGTMDELHGSRALIAALAAVAGSENEVFADVFRTQADCGCPL